MSYSLVLANEKAIYQHYLPFITHGSLFVPTEDQCVLQEVVQVELTLFHPEPQNYTITGKVVWVTPKGNPNLLPAGIGVELDPINDHQLKLTLEQAAKAVPATLKTHFL